MPSDPVRVMWPIPLQVLLTNQNDPDIPPQALTIDEVTGSLATIDIVHHEVHEGELFHTEYSASVNNGANLDVQVTTTATSEAHMTAVVSAGGQSLVYLYEAPNTSAGTALTVYNMRRIDITHTSPYTAVHTPTVTGVGTTPLINGRLIAGGTSVPSRVGGETRGATEWILAPNTKYLLRVNNNSGGAIVIHVTIEAYGS